MYKIILNTLILLSPFCVSGQAVSQGVTEVTANSENSVDVPVTSENSSLANAQAKEEILTQEGRASYRKKYAELKTQIEEIRKRLDEALITAVKSGTPTTPQQHAQITAQHREEYFEDYVKLEELQEEAGAIGLVLNTDLLHFNSLADTDSVKIAKEKIQSLKDNSQTSTKSAAEEKINALILKDSYNASTE